MPFASGWRRAPLILLLFGAAIAAACGVDDYQFVPDDEVDAGPDSGPPPPATPTVCGSDGDCAIFAATTVCDTRSGYCVECVAEREAELDRCGDGTYCRADGRCGTGCGSDLDCRGITCDLATQTCMGCSGNADCGAGTICEGSRCVPGCAADDTCPLGWSCCTGVCKNPNTDATSCSGCDAACEPTGQCINGVCGPGPCETGLGECNGNAADGCETDLVSNPSNCGRCRAVCVSGRCSGGMCTSSECAPGTADCNGDESDRCETSLNTVSDCLMCMHACSAVNGEPSCTSRGCAIACDDGFGDCDEDVDTGCEANLTDDPQHCGGCGTVCENENGSTRCVDGECRPTCGEGFDDCDGNPENGCETDLTTSLGACGACGASCSPANATGACVEGVCEAGCATGFANCNGRIEDGCEADLSSPETCGDCDHACSANGGTPSCNPDGTCGITCNEGTDDCINGVLDGCETNTNVSVLHCGMCGHACPSAVGIPACNDGVCGVSTCTDPNRECDANDATVCETNVTNDTANCGGCGMACFYPNGTGLCVNRGCVLDDCNSGFADCNAALGCETRLGTLDSCRTCGETCRNEHGTTSCETNGCVPSCQIGWGDCDGNRNNGCETELNSLTNCGMCGRTCATAHGRPSCATGSCEVTSCDTGWDDCDDAPGNGCERPISTLTNCGGCNVACNLPHASEACVMVAGTANFTCTLTACDSGFSDCSSAQAGCETELGTMTDCRACGDSCSNTHGTTTCNATTGCMPTCDAGWKSCDGNARNGCERNIRSLTDCGDCDVDCDLANAGESCSTGTCVLGTCTGNFGNCDSQASNGCETPLGTTANCAACGNSCSNAHGSNPCSAGACAPSCDVGFGSCDSNAANGCETSTRTLTDCNVCGVACDVPNSNETCATGTCTATTCATGFAECVAGAPNCETALGDSAHCRSCNEVCTNAHGTTSCNPTTGCVPVCAAGFKSCDDVADNGCERDIRTLTSCGDCDVPCSFSHASAACTTGTCAMGACDSGFSDCTSDNGCETQLGTNSNCSACGNACSNAHGTNTCGGSPGSFDCTPVCDAGFKNCNADPDDGCETPVNTNTNCVNCGQACSFPNGAASCATGTCTMTGCGAGFADCTMVAGCETTLGTTANCASCGNTCTNAHGGTACTGMPGAYDCAPSCAAGFANCNGNPDDGCETPTTTLTDCSACGAPCSFANAAETCASGTCALGTCDAGFGDCDAQSGNGCETALGNVSHCNACGNACVNSHGTTSCTGTPGAFACTPVCDANWGSCNANSADGCETDLTTTQNCGLCGRVCGVAAPFCVQNAGVYNCAAQLSISYVADTDHSSGSLSSSFTHNLVTPIGQARIVLLSLAMAANASGSVPEVVTFGGTAMTFYPTPPAAPFGNNQAFVAFYYLLDASLGGAGTKTVVIDSTGGTNNPTQLRANLLEFKGVHQTTPISNAVTANNGNCGSSQWPIHAITTTNANSFLVDIAAAYTGGGVTATASGGLTNTLSFTSSSPLAAVGGYRGPLAVGSYTVGWNVSACNNSAHYIVALRPGTAP